MAKRKCRFKIKWAYTQEGRRPFFVFKGGNGETVVTSQVYQGGHDACMKGIECVSGGAADAIIEDTTKKDRQEDEAKAKKAQAEEDLKTAGGPDG